MWSPRIEQHPHPSLSRQSPSSLLSRNQTGEGQTAGEGQSEDASLRVDPSTRPCDARPAQDGRLKVAPGLAGVCREGRTKERRLKPVPLPERGRM
jgi:hypothetical protein